MSYSFTPWSATPTLLHPSSSSPPTKQTHKQQAPTLMAVEAHHLHLFPSQQHVPNRAAANAMENPADAYGSGAHVVGFYPPAFPANLVVPFCGNPAGAGAGAVVSVDASDSGLTFNDLSVVSSSQPRKRQRASQPPLQAPPPTFSFLGEDITSTIQQQQLEVDGLVAQHAEKVRRELWERRRRFSRHVASAVEAWVLRRIRAKEEEIEKMGKLNTALEEHVRSLCVENQLWRDLAQTNEAAANALRSNLEQVLAQGGAAGSGAAPDAAAADDAESCCDNMGEPARIGAEGWSAESLPRRRVCRRCGAGEPSVLLLPCRHLCLCAACGPATVACPVCMCDKNGSVNVNMSYMS